MLSPQFAHWMTQDLRLADKTVHTYLRCVMALLADGPCTVERMAEVRNRIGMSAQWTNQQVAAFRMYGKFLVHTGVWTENLAETLSMVTVPKRLPKPFEREHILHLFTTIEAAPQTLEVQQDRLMLECLYGSGIRQSELARIRLGDITQDRMTVIGKRNKERQTVVTREAWSALQTHTLSRLGDSRSASVQVEFDDDMAFRDLMRRFPEWPVLWARPTLPVMALRDARRWITRRCAHWLTEAGLTPSTSPNPHRLRHSFATHLLDSGQDVISIQRLLGHESLASTAIYAGVGSTSLRKAQARLER